MKWRRLGKGKYAASAFIGGQLNTVVIERMWRGWCIYAVGGNQLIG